MKKTYLSPQFFVMTFHCQTILAGSCNSMNGNGINFRQGQMEEGDGDDAAVKMQNEFLWGE